MKTMERCGISVQKQLKSITLNVKLERETDSAADIVMQKMETGFTGETSLKPSVHTSPLEHRRWQIIHNYPL